jgi:uridine phosphorylase
MKDTISLLDPQNLDSEVVLTATDYLSWAANEKNITIPTVPRSCLFAFDPELLEAFQAKFDVVQRRDWPATHSRLFSVKGPNTDLSIVLGTVGAPFASMTMEELIVCGARSFVSAGASGILQTHITAPAIIVAEAAIRDEGTSFHYMPAAFEIQIPQAVVEQLVDVLKKHGGSPYVGKIWTTDALYRESKVKVDKYRKEGVLAVEMEIAALATVSQYRGVKYIGLLYALDNLSISGASFPATSRRELVDKHMLVDAICEYFAAS